MPLHKSGEDYLEAILVLQKKKGMVRSADVARHMDVSKPSVCHAVATLKKGGFLSFSVKAGGEQFVFGIDAVPHCQLFSIIGKIHITGHEVIAAEILG